MKINLKNYITIIFVCISFSSNAQQFSLIKDINPTGDSWSEFFNEWNKDGNNSLFIADDGVHGYELWTTDGTGSGTTLLKDINPNGDFFGGTESIVLNDELYFFGDDGTHGAELWKTDGTAAGTVLVKDIFQTTVAYEPDQTNFVRIGDFIYFLANDGIHGREIWKSDGTATGTTMLADLNTAGDFVLNNSLNTLYLLNGDLIINGSIATQVGLWKVSITGVAQFLYTTNESNINGFVFNNKFYFKDFAIGGYKLYATDGTAVGSKEVGSMTFSGESLIYNGNCYFLGDNNDNQKSTNLWKINSSDNSIVLVKKISNKMPLYSELILLNNSMIFYVNDDTKDYVWMKSDGTAQGTILLYDFSTTTHNASDLYGYNYVFNNELYLVAEYNTTDYALYKTDGTTVQFVHNFIESNEYGDLWSFGVINSNLYVCAGNATTGFELYGPGQTTATVSSLLQSSQIAIYPNPFTDVISVEVNNNQSYTYQLIDMQGEKIQTETSLQGSIHTIPTDKLQAGMYMLLVFENEILKESIRLVK